MKVLAKGAGNHQKIEIGQVIEWRDDLIESPYLIKNKIVYSMGKAPLYRMAFFIENGAKAVLLEKGGRNYHPLILLRDAAIPAIAGIGTINLHDKIVTANSMSGVVYQGGMGYKKSRPEEISKVPKTVSEVYVNVGYPTAFKAAARTGADGIGLFRTEFCAAKTLSKILTHKISPKVTVRQLIDKTSEADALYTIVRHERLKNYIKNDLTDAIIAAVRYFGKKEIIIRTIDIARDEKDALGNRGIRRCISEGGYSLRLLSEAVKKALGKCKAADVNIGIILPLVSHYSQIKTTLDIFLKSGLTLKKNGTENKTSIKFGWEIEQPAASQNIGLWIEAFSKEYGQPPHMIGIGTNDLTQFTIALGRDVYSQEKDQKSKSYLRELYDEKDFSVIRQIYEVSKYCRNSGIKLFLLGEAATDPNYARLILSFGIVPSVSIDGFKKVKDIIYMLEKKNTPPEQVVTEYIDNVCKSYPKKVRGIIRGELLKVFDI
jgi:phosphoenolpyruvate-protein kinase (PTS system EI component)